MWEHLCYLYEHTQAESGLYVGNRLRFEHTSFNKMRVNLAAQVMFLKNCLTVKVMYIKF